MFKKIVNLFYLLLWGIPFVIFCRDFLGTDLSILDGAFYSTFKTSLIQGLLSVIFSFFCSLVPAYYVAYNNNRISKIVESLNFIPFIFPVISAVLSFSLIYNMEFFKKFEILYSLKAIIIANVFYNTPLFVKYISTGLRSLGSDYEDEIILTGIPQWKALILLKLPVIAVHIFKCSFLVFLYSFTSFILPISLGGLKYATIEAEIAYTLMGSSDFSKVILLGVVQGIVLLIFNFMINRVKEFEVNLNSEKISYIKSSKVLEIITILYLLLEVAIISISIILSFINIYTHRITLEHYKILFDFEFNQSFPVIKSFFNSILFSGISAGCVVLLAYILVKSYTRFTNFIVFLTLGFSTAFLAITIVYLNILFSIPLWILLIQGYILIALPIGYSFIFSSVKNFPSAVIEASYLDCPDRFSRFRYIEFPMLKKIFLSAFFQIFALLLGEFTLSYTMQIGYVLPTLPLISYSMISSKKYMESSALNSLILVFIFILFYLSNRLLEKDKER